MRLFATVSLTIALILACSPTELCACPPALGIGTVFGTVTDAEGAAAPSLAIHVRVYQVACEAMEIAVIDAPRVVTDATGRYRYALRTIVPADDACVRVAAVSAGDDTLASATARMRLVSSYGTRERPDSVRVDLRVP